MSARKISFSIGEYYHIYNRGVDKRVIFMDIHDHRRFVALLYICNSTKAVDINTHLQEGGSFLEIFEAERDDELVDVGAYCLMPNHFHLLLREKVEGGITKFMWKLLTAYSMYFNSKNARTGALFGGRFKAKHADTDEYLKYLFAYIHLNPVKLIDQDWKKNGIINREAAIKHLGGYHYSSYLDYQGVRRLESNIINSKKFPEYFTKVNDFNAYVEEWLESESF